VSPTRVITPRLEAAIATVVELLDPICAARLEYVILDAEPHEKARAELLEAFEEARAKP